MDALYQLAPAASGDGQKGEPMVPQIVTFTPEGRKVWNDWWRAHAREMNDETFPDRLRAPWSKFRAYTARLTLIIHRLRVACGETQAGDAVDKKSVAAAAALTTYFKSHTRRVYSFLHANQATREALIALEWIRRHHKQTVTTNELIAAHLRGISSKEDAIAALGTLTSMGYGTVAKAAVRGGERITFTRNSE